MKIAIDKRYFTMAQAEAVQARHAEMKEYMTDDEIKRAAMFYAGTTCIAGVYDVKAKISRHEGGLYVCKGDDCTVDCWVEMLIETDDACYRVGFYWLDFYQLAQGIGYSNAAEVRSRAYIRKFAEVR